MVNNKLKSVVLAATTIAVAMSVGFAAPASALELSADKTVVRNGEGVVFTTDAPGGNLAAFFIDGELWGSGSIETTPNPFTWDIVGPCASVDVTYRVYDVSFDDQEPSFSDAYADGVDVRFAGDNSVECDDSWGAGKSADKLATTGSDASAVSGLTGVAGIAALTVAVAVARRTRRARRAQR